MADGNCAQWAFSLLSGGQHRGSRQLLCVYLYNAQLAAHAESRGHLCSHLCGDLGSLSCSSWKSQFQSNAQILPLFPPTGTLWTCRPQTGFLRSVRALSPSQGGLLPYAQCCPSRGDWSMLVPDKGFPEDKQVTDRAPRLHCDPQRVGAAWTPGTTEGAFLQASLAVVKSSGWP